MSVLLQIPIKKRVEIESAETALETPAALFPRVLQAP
jgi:hypothetical protein